MSKAKTWVIRVPMYVPGGFGSVDTDDKGLSDDLKKMMADDPSRKWTPEELVAFIHHRMSRHDMA